MRYAFLALLCLILGCQPQGVPTSPYPPAQPPLAYPGLTEPKQVVVYDFWATWCGPCRVFSPTFEAWKTKYSTSTISFLKANVDKEKALARQYNIQSIPTVVVVVNGVEVKRWVGPPNEAELLPFLK